MLRLAFSSFGDSSRKENLRMLRSGRDSDATSKDGAFGKLWPLIDASDKIAHVVSEGKYRIASRLAAVRTNQLYRLIQAKCKE